MTSFVRESKFRNTEIKLAPRESYYDQISVFTGQIEGCNLVAANSKVISFIDGSGSGSSLKILPLSSTGKIHDRILSIRCHTQTISDFSFDHFSRDILFTCSTDGRLKAWRIPNDEIWDSEISDPVLNLSSTKGYPLKGITQHPSASDIVAVRGSKYISLFDLESSIELSISSEGLFKNDVQSLIWSHTGHVLVSTSKDKTVRLFDLRLPSESAVIGSGNAHTGTRTTSSVWLGSTPYFITTGHSMMMDRQVMTWDHRNLAKAVKIERIDGSTSPIIPFYDPDNSLLTLCGKGDTNVRLYEVSTSGELFALSNTNVGDVFRGAALLPKHCNNRLGCEVLRMLKLADSSIQPISIVVPRKEKLKYHEDLYPPTTSGAPPAMNADQYRNGENLAPNTLVFEPPEIVNGPTLTRRVNQSSSDDISKLATAATTTSEGQDLDLVSEINIKKAPRIVFTSSLKFRNIFGTENPKPTTYYNLHPQLTYSDNAVITANDTFWAIPYQGGGGPVYVSTHTNYGKVMTGTSILNGHKAPVQDICFSPFNSNALLTGSNDGTIKLWTLPPDGQGLESVQADVTLSSHLSPIKTCSFHPVIDGLVISSSSDLTVRFHDVKAGKEISGVSLLDVADEDLAIPNTLNYNYDGSLLSVACKDRIIRIIDPRVSEVVLSTPAGSVLGRNLSSAWCYSSKASKNSSFGNAILSVSSNSSGLRNIHLWDTRSMASPISTTTIDNAAGQLFPVFDEDTGICVMIGKGDKVIRFYELALGSEGAFCLKSADYQSSGETLVGACLLPKSNCDVRNVEVARMLKLTTDSVIPISFTLPRIDSIKEYFQDDVFLPTRSKLPPGDIESWTSFLSGSDLPQPQYVSLKPPDMLNLSEKPVERVVRQSAVFRDEINKQAMENKVRDETFNRFQVLAEQAAKHKPNTSGGKANNSEPRDNDSDDGWDD